MSAWAREGTLLWRDALPPRLRSATVAAFDLDHTLAFPRSGAKFAQSADDWQWAHPCVPPLLQSLHRDGHHIVIFSNQAGVAKNAASADDVAGRIDQIALAAAVPISAFCACAADEFRKPSLAMWDRFTNLVRQRGGEVDRSWSFFVGDAAGRATPSWTGLACDFSCSDRKFGYNAGLRFFTPEEFFLRRAPDAFSWGDCSPDSLAEALKKPIGYPRSLHSLDPGPELLVLVGPPGCGKSTLYRRLLAPHGYEHVNRDTLKTIPACVSAAQRALGAGRSVCVDNTSPSAEARKVFIDVARAAGVPCRCAVVSTPLEMARHLNAVRGRCGISTPVPEIAYRTYQSNLQDPSESEGFSEVIRVPLWVDFRGLPPSVQDAYLCLW